MTKKIKKSIQFEKANVILTVSCVMEIRFSCEVMHESWVENIKRVICHILFDTILVQLYTGTRIYKFNRND
jgi:hypothetical protein